MLSEIDKLWDKSIQKQTNAECTLVRKIMQVLKKSLQLSKPLQNESQAGDWANDAFRLISSVNQVLSKLQADLTLEPPSYLLGKMCLEGSPCV